MSAEQPAVGERWTLPRARLDELFAVLREEGYGLIGPTVRDGAVVFDSVERAADLPAGWTDVQEAGSYRLARRDDEALFGYHTTADALRRHLQVPVVTLFRARRRDGRFELLQGAREAPKRAFIGARACDVAAIAVQDRTLRDGRYADPDYAARRANVFVVAAQCTQAGDTCFCVSMGTAPRARTGFDLALTELLDAGGHRFVLEVGTSAGARVLARLAPALERTAPEELALADAEMARAAAEQGRALDAENIRDVLSRNLEHPRWEATAARCLSCASCTLVCPTCFCTTVDDRTDLPGEVAERTRRWDSCFTLEHSYLHGGSVRASTRARYRQWLTHKLAGWIDQFGVSGCVGCGRCITWCPVGIDITQEAAALRASDGGASPGAAVR